MSLEVISNKLKSYVGFAIKADKAVLGIDKILSLKKLPPVILYDKSTGNDTLKKLSGLKAKGAEVFMADELMALTGKQGVKVIGILEKSLAEAITNIYKEKRNERT